MMVISNYGKLRILSLHQQGYKISEILEFLALEDEISVLRHVVHIFIKRYKDRGTITKKEGSGSSFKLSPAVQQIIEHAIQDDDETTATQLQSKLATNHVYVSLAKILRNQQQLGWVYRGSAYCQLIRIVNEQKRLEWARANIYDDFDNVIWSDESSIQLDTHRRYCCRKEGEAPCPKL